MAYPRTDFLIGRRLLLAAIPAFFAAPALAKVSPDLLTGGLAKFSLAKEPKPLPDLSFTDADDKAVKLADYKGKKVLGALDISVLPTSVLVDPEGREIGRLEGDADWDKPEALALMKAAVDSAG